MFSLLFFSRIHCEIMQQTFRAVTNNPGILIWRIEVGFQFKHKTNGIIRESCLIFYFWMMYCVNLAQINLFLRDTVVYGDLPRNVP